MTAENNDDINLYLSSIDNYIDEYDCSVNDVVSVFSTIIYDYLNHCEKTIYISDINYLYYVIENGVNLLHNIFTLIYTYTKNITLSRQYTERGYYIYCEFIGKVGDNNHKYLQLNSKDATIFVLKKTIYEINNTHTRNFTTTDKERSYINQFTKSINLYIECVKIYLKVNYMFDMIDSKDTTNKYNDNHQIHLFRLEYLKNITEPLLTLTEDAVEQKTNILHCFISQEYMGRLYCHGGEENNITHYLVEMANKIGFHGFNINNKIKNDFYELLHNFIINILMDKNNL